MREDKNKINKNDYQKLLQDNITTTYKKSDTNKLDEININAKKIGSKLELNDRLEKMHESEAYVTVKDHKDNFPNKISCRLINPSKSDIGKISKRILDSINKTIIEKTTCKHWKNTSSVIDWFSKISNKNECTFIQFDIENFYPSISRKLFNEAISFAKLHCDINDDDLSIILQSRKTLLFFDNNPWVMEMRTLMCQWVVLMGQKFAI